MRDSRGGKYPAAGKEKQNDDARPGNGEEIRQGPFLRVERVCAAPPFCRIFDRMQTHFLLTGGKHIFYIAIFNDWC